LRPDIVARERGSKKPVASSSSEIDGVNMRGRSETLREEGAGGATLRDDGAAGATLRERLPLLSLERTSASDSSRPGRLVKGSMGPFGERGATWLICRAQARERPSKKIEYVPRARAQAYETTRDADR
jgi:hypothetical protein